MTQLFLPAREVEKTGDDTPAKGLWAYVWRMSGWSQLGVGLVALTVAGLTVAPLELQRRLLNEALGRRDVDALWCLAGMYAAVIVIISATKYVLRLYQAWLTESAVRYTRQHLLGLLSKQRIDAGSGESVTVIASEIDKLGGFVGEGASNVIASLGVLLAVSAYMIWTDAALAAVALAILLPQVAVIVLVQMRMNRLMRFRLTFMRRFSDAIDREAESDRSIVATYVLYRNRMRLAAWKYGGKIAANALSMSGPLAILVVGGLAVVNGDAEVGTLVAFISGFERMNAPAREMLTHYRFIEQARIQHKMIAGWMK